MSEITINGRQAAIIYTALELAIGDVKDVLTRNTKASAPYRGAMVVQLAEYEAEKARLSSGFPVLCDGHSNS